MSLPFQFIGLYRLGASPIADDSNFENRLREIAGAPLYSDERFVLFGAHEDRWPGSPFHTDSRTVTLILGEPLLIEEKTPIPRADALPILAQALGEDKIELLRRTHGSYCGIHYHCTRGTLRLFTDKIGLHGLFIAEIGNVLMFASSPELLMQLVEPYSEGDEAGAAETIAFGYPLGDRTLLKACKRLLEAEVVQCKPSGISREHYHHWTASIDQALSLEEATDRIHAAFTQAVSDRLKVAPKTAPFAFLSGGMDSRLIVDALCASGHRPVTLNVAPSETQDALFGQSAASFFGTRHHLFPATSISLANAIDEGVRRTCEAHQDLEGHLWWSGDGGSVGLGHVYLTDASCPKSETAADTIAHVLIRANNWRISTRALKKNWRHLGEQPQRGIVEELERLSHFPPEKRAYAFLLFNDQRRHSDRHFSTLDARDHDLILPFFDDRLIQAVLDTPIEHLLRHKLYNKLFERHLPPTHAVPWQAYPGHEACPYPQDRMGRYQWDSWAEKSSLRQAQRDSAREAVLSLIYGKTAPQMNKFSLVMASLLTYVGLRDMRYVLKTGAVLSQARTRRATPSNA